MLPTSLRPSRLGLLAAVLGASALVAPSAQAACAPTASTKAFQRFGDQADYTLLSGGAFESSMGGWSLNGASVISGNETFKVRSSSDARSLAVPARSKVVSPTFCIGTEHPTFRLFARKLSGSWATMVVKLRWTDSRGGVNETTIASLDGARYSTWQPTPSLPLALTLPLTAASQSITGQIVLDPEDTGGAWQVDDIFIDPSRRS